MLSGGRGKGVGRGEKSKGVIGRSVGGLVGDEGGGRSVGRKWSCRVDEMSWPRGRVRYDESIAMKHYI